VKVLFENCKVNNEVDAYLLGFIYADGSLTNKVKDKHYSLTIGLSKKDELHLLNLNRFLNGKIRYLSSNIKGYDKVYESIRLTKCDVSLVENLKKLGINPNKTYICGNPQENIPEDLIHHFIRGIFDGDGTICCSNNKYISGFVGTDENLFKFIKLHLEKNLNRNISLRIEKTKYFRINLSGNPLCLNLYNYLYKDATLFLERKYNKFKNITTTNGKNGMAGVSYSALRKTKKKWIVSYQTKNKKIYGGIFLTKEEAESKLLELKKLYEQ
jgi:hypothetical protein